MTTFRKLLSGALASAMLLSMLPLSAVAADEAQEPLAEQPAVTEPVPTDGEPEAVKPPASEPGDEAGSETPDAPAHDGIMTLPAFGGQPSVAEGGEDALPPAADETLPPDENADETLPPDENAAEPPVAFRAARALAAEPLSQYIGNTFDTFYHSILDMETQTTHIAYCYNYRYATPPASGVYYDREEYQGQAPGPLFPKPDAAPGAPDAEMQGRVQRLMFAGYPFDALGLQQKYGLTDEAARLQTQYALWFALEQYGNAFDSAAIDDFTENYETLDVHAYLRQVLYAALGTLDDMLPKEDELVLDGSADVTFSWDEAVELYRSPVLRLSGFSGEYAITAPEGISVHAEDGAEKTVFHTGEGFYFTTVDGEHLSHFPQIAFAVSDYDYIYPDRVYLYTPLELPKQNSSNYKLYQNLFTFETGSHTRTARQDFTLTVDKIIEPDGEETKPTPHGVARVSKVDGEGRALEGASFVLYQERAVGELTEKLYYTTQGGSAGWTADAAQADVFSGSSFSLPALPYGAYFLHETVVPSGYQAPAADTPVSLSAPAADVTIVNVRKPGGGGSNDDDDNDDDDRPSKPQPPSGGGMVDVPDTETPLAGAPESGETILDIEDGETPLAEAPTLPETPEAVQISAPQTPKANAAPKTGDEAPVLPLLALLLASLGGCAAALRKKAF